MKYVFILSLLVHGAAYAQTGIKTSPPTAKRVTICCSKATNKTTSPTTTIKSGGAKSSAGTKQ